VLLTTLQARRATTTAMATFLLRGTRVDSRCLQFIGERKYQKTQKKSVIGGGFHSPGSEKGIVKSTESYVLLVFSQKQGRMIEDLCSII
jgi:hypothetical protein